jgi:hypothetical protein
MDRLEVVLKSIGFAKNNHSYNQGSDTGENGSNHEVGSKDSRVPHGLECHGENERNNRMD